MYRHTHKGFSLIELLVYIAITVGIGVIVIQSVITLVQSFNSLRVSEDIHRSAITVLERTTREVRDTVSVDTVNSVFNTHPGILVLNTLDESENPVTTTIYVQNGSVYIQEGAAPPSALTPEKVTVTELSFARYATAFSEAVEITLELERMRGRVIKTEQFRSGVVLRGSY